MSGLPSEDGWGDEWEEQQQGMGGGGGEGGGEEYGDEYGEEAVGDEGDWGEVEMEGEAGDWGSGSGVLDVADSVGVSLVPAPTSPIMSRQQSYQVMNGEGLHDKQNALIRQTAEVLDVSVSEAACLLRQYGWKSRKLESEWFTDQGAVRESVGLAANRIMPAQLPNGLYQCQTAYCDEYPVEEVTALWCGHVFCDGCWGAYLESQIRHGASCIFTRCPGMRCGENHAHKFGCACKQVVPEELFFKYVKDATLIDKYKRWLLDSFVEGQRHIKWCPRPGCTYALNYQTGGSKSVQCKCGHYFCFTCIAGSAAINLPCGISIPLQHFVHQQAPRTLSYHAPSKSVCVSDVSAWLCQGSKECVEVLLSSGQVLTCTPDHRIMTWEGQWMEARHIKLNHTIIAATVEYPLVDIGKEVSVSMSDWCLDVRCSLGYGLNLHDRLPHAMALARIMGYAWATNIRGQEAEGEEDEEQSESAAQCPSGVVLRASSCLDIDALRCDVELLVGEGVVSMDGSHVIILPSQLLQAFQQLGMHAIPTQQDVVGVPSFLLADTCPQLLVREFIAAAFGHSASPITYHTHTKQFDTIKLFIPTRVDLVDQQRELLECQLSHLLSRCNLPPTCLSFSIAPTSSTAVQTDATPGTSGSLTHTAAAAPLTTTLSTTICAELSLDHVFDFATHIGYRYASNKQIRLTAANSYFRQRDMVHKQHLFLARYIHHHTSLHHTCSSTSPTSTCACCASPSFTSCSCSCPCPSPSPSPSPACLLRRGKEVLSQQQLLHPLIAHCQVEQLTMSHLTSQLHIEQCVQSLLALQQQDASPAASASPPAAPTPRAPSPTCLSRSSSPSSLTRSTVCHVEDMMDGENCAVGFPILPVHVLAMRCVGVRDVYDISVPVHHSFVANSLLVHNCLEEAHTPAPCDLVKKWLLREKSDDATEIWLAAKTKECPKCQVRIEKNKACNHMTCIKCGHHFCWLCKDEWKNHGSSTGGYYICKKYDEDVKVGKYSEEEQKIASNQKLLQKYTFYYKRYKESANAIQLTQKLGAKLEKSLRNEDYQKYSFLLDAIDKLISARRVLQWTYALAYYLKSGGLKHLFEYQQDMLCGSTEALQDIMDNHITDLDQLNSLRKEIINKTSSMDKFRQEMVAQVERGDFEDLLLAQADAGLDTWACVNCRADNQKEQAHCVACGSCQLHGEADCKACKPAAHKT